MFLLDTNVLSELMRPSPESRVTDWFVGIDANEIYTMALCKAEIVDGLTRLPEEFRRQALQEKATALFDGVLAGRVLPFSAAHADAYSWVCATRRRLGRAISTIDAQIAAVCLVSGMGLVTRNVKDFEDIGVQLYNPWS